VREGPHEAIFPLLGDGTVDLMVAAWLPEGHAQYWQRYGRNAREVARLYDVARFFWAVPDYVPSEDVAAIGDLARPPVMARMTRDIQAIGPGATITTASMQVLERYGLASAYRVVPGTSTSWLDAYTRLSERGDWFVFPTWTPQFLNNAETLRELHDPLGVLGHANHAALVAPSDRFDALPARTRAALARIQLSLDDVNRMDWAVNVEGRSVQDAAQAWLQANPHHLARWLGEPEITID
jgi:glycine betaine/proline transport system substrate-binding protein